ncbi:ABC transporter substrate-binding protein [Bordetella avium]|uniref:ABC transporter substrate-binding protein n=5 Tax=Bordetella avium TaxID=521 RepID=UPI0013B38D55|nr:ABC transporter substrate-binding protein [Bordetella avium]WQE34525.1 ABC transporter substrate-binding protein [Bordetella avium]
MRLLLLLCLLLSTLARADNAAPILVGELPDDGPDAGFQAGWRLALDDINRAGGVMGRPLTVKPLDPNSGPGDAVALFDGAGSAQALAHARQAAAWRLPYLAAAASSDRLVWQEGNPYTFRLPPSTRMRVAALAPRALGLRQKRWAIVYPTTLPGEEAAATFGAMMTAFQSKTEVVSRLPVEPSGINPQLMQTLAESRPQALMVALRGQDLAQFLHLLAKAPLPAVVILHGEDLPADSPPGWISATYSHRLPESQAAFSAAYQAAQGQTPTKRALQGYIALHSLAEALRAAQSTDAEKLIEALEGLKLDTPAGPIQYRKIDHQATLGLHLAVTGDNGEPEQLQFIDGVRLQLPDTLARRMREPARPPVEEHTAAGHAPPVAPKTVSDLTGAAADQARFGVSPSMTGGAALPIWPD